jgi:hypothetical protein
MTGRFSRPDVERMGADAARRKVQGMGDEREWQAGPEAQVVERKMGRLR